MLCSLSGCYKGDTLLCDARLEWKAAHTKMNEGSLGAEALKRAELVVAPSERGISRIVHGEGTLIVVAVVVATQVNVNTQSNLP